MNETESRKDHTYTSCASLLIISVLTPLCPMKATGHVQFLQLHSWANVLKKEKRHCLMHASRERVVAIPLFVTLLSEFARVSMRQTHNTSKSYDYRTISWYNLYNWAYSYVRRKAIVSIKCHVLYHKGKPVLSISWISQYENWSLQVTSRVLRKGDDWEAVLREHISTIREKRTAKAATLT